MPAFEAANIYIPERVYSKKPKPQIQRRCVRPPHPPNAPDPARWAARLAVSTAQAARGCRPVSQLHRWVSREILESLQVKAQRVHRINRGREPQRMHIHVRRIRISEPAFGVVEAAVVMDDGRRPYAVAMRLEWRRDRWLASVLHVL
ncbi:MAG: Rv3235 family protein [Bifidobacteriaceae bacterium]|nr:Rv3235 family protein [Bifidobacteriaceae bacterium]